MTGQQHNRSIRVLVEQTGLDGRPAFRAALAARNLLSRLRDGDRVVWPRDRGGLAWEALDTKSGTAPSDGDPILYFVDRSDYPLTAEALELLTTALTRKGYRLRCLYLSPESADPDSGPVPDPVIPVSPSPSGNAPRFSDSETQDPEPEGSSRYSGAIQDSVHRPLASWLIKLALRLESRHNGRWAIPKAPRDGIDVRTASVEASRNTGEQTEVLGVEAEITSSEKKPEYGKRPGAEETPNPDGRTDHLYLSTTGIPKKETPEIRCPVNLRSILPDAGCVPVEGALSLATRFDIAECLAVCRFRPIVPLRPGEMKQASAVQEELKSRDLPIIWISDGTWAVSTAFCDGSDLAVLTPASEQDLAGALKWAAGQERSVLILPPGDGAHAERSVFRSNWETGGSVLVRESLKGSAGRLLLVAPGTMGREASRAVERLVRDNIAVTFLSLRFLQPLNSHDIETRMEQFDICLIAQPSEFPGDLRSTLAALAAADSDRRIVFAGAGQSAAELSELGSRLLREKRIQRTVDDVKADRWR